MQVYPPSTIIFIKHELDWSKYPGPCNSLYVNGCAETTQVDQNTRMTTITLREPIEAAVARKDVCSPFKHELDHALGKDHSEAHMYAAVDLTRGR